MTKSMKSTGSLSPLVSVFIFLDSLPKWERVRIKEERDGIRKIKGRWEKDERKVDEARETDRQRDKEGENKRKKRE